MTQPRRVKPGAGKGEKPLRRPSVFLLGDSISVHYSPFLAKSGVCTLQMKGGVGKALENLDKPRGSNGGSSRQVLAYLSKRSFGSVRRPDLALLNAGLHDIRRVKGSRATLVPLDEYVENPRRCIGLCRERRIPVAWIRTTPVFAMTHNRFRELGFERFEQDLKRFNNAADLLMESLHVPCIDLHGFTLGLDPDHRDLFCDHVHFKEPVRKAQAAFLAGWISGFLNQSAQGPGKFESSRACEQDQSAA